MVTNTNELHHLLTPQDLADLIRRPIKAIYQMNHRGQIPGAVKLGAKLLFKRDTVLDWINQCEESNEGKQ